MKISEAMGLKRTIGANCSIDIKMLDTLRDGIVLTIEQNSVNPDALMFITDFVNRHNLSLLLESERYFISTKTLSPNQSVWDV
jgi:hypothetical protein